MDFVLTEAEVETDDFKLVFSDDEDIECDSSPSSEDEIFIDDSDQDEEEDTNFYRSFDNREEYHTFKNQFKNPVEVSKMPEGEFYGEEDDLPELFDPEEREEVAFHSFDKDSDKAANFKKSLLCFSDVENHFFMRLSMV